MLRYLPSLLLVGSLIATLCSAKDERPCTVHGEDGEYFDLNPLKASTDYTFQSPGGREFIINVCRSVVSETWSPKVDDPDNIAAFTRDFGGIRGDFSLGSMNNTLAVQDHHPLLLLQNGSPCGKVDSMKASTAIRFICDRGVFGAGTPQLIAQLPPEEDSACAFFIEWRTHYACPAGGPSRIWGIIWIIVMGLVALGLLFIIVGVLYRRYVLHLRGFAQLPTVPSVFKSCGAGLTRLRDMVEDVFSRRSDPYDRYGSAWSGWGRGGRVGFDRVPASLEEAESILGSEGEETPRQSFDDGNGPANPWNNHNGQARPAGMDGEGVIRL